MIVTLVSESSGDSAARACSILDSYLPRIGRRTWSGHISAEGLEELRTALRKKATRATSIACHRGHGSRSFVLWTVGSRGAFGHGGRVPIATSRKVRAVPDLLQLPHLLPLAVAIAADFHDLGKLSSGMQGVLARSAEADKREKQPVRHEFLSVLLLRLLVTVSRASCDQDLLAMLSNKDEAVALVTKAWDRLLRSSEAAEFCNGSATSPAVVFDAGGKSVGLLPPGDFPFFRGVALMVATHHRLFRASADRTSVLLSSAAHVPDTKQASWKAYRTPCIPLADALDAPAGSGRRSWASTLALDARRTLSAFARGGKTGDEHAWLSTCANTGRLSLMLGDHDASHRSVPHPSRDPVGAVERMAYANTRKVEATQPGSGWLAVERGVAAASHPPSVPATSGRVLGDAWDVHMHKVRRSSLAAYGGLHLGRGAWVGIAPDEVPHSLSMRSPDARFSWQDVAADMLRSTCARHDDLDGCLVFLVAGTGTGKTVAAPKLVVAARDGCDLRLNVCLGLRSLTLQTGDEYRDRLGFTAGQAAIVIGSQASRLLHENAAADPQSDAPSENGTDAGDLDDEDIVSGSDCGDLPPFVERMVRSAKSGHEALRAKMSAPILVCTVDTLVSASNPSGSRHLADTVRLASADLIIDEIDSFDTEDFVALLRLVYLASYHGRMVVAASATMRQEHAEAIRAAYATGRRDAAGLRQVKPGFVVGWFSETTAVAQADDAAVANGFADRHRDVAAAICVSLSSKAVRRRASVVEIPADATETRAFAAVHAACREFHSSNSVFDPASGKRVSVGFVRWNRIASCRAFGAYLLDGDDPDMFVAVHHSRFPLAVKDTVDRALAAMLNRKHAPGDADPMLSDPHVRSCIDRAPGTDVILVVSTTPLLEAGRDLDADWAVTEPCSVRSAVQLAGRVRRHRPWSAPGTNIGIMSMPLPSPAGTQSTRLANPGVSTPLRLVTGSARASVPRNATAEVLFDTAAWAVCLDASACLGTPTDACGSAEAAILRYGTLGEKPGAPLVTVDDDVGQAERMRVQASILGVQGMMRPRWQWDDLHPRFRRFRRPVPGSTDVEVRSAGTRWLKRTGASIAHAKASKASEWMPMPPDHVATDWLPADARRAEGRLMLGAATYDSEAQAERIEESVSRSGGVVGRYVSRELRSFSFLHYGKDAEPRLAFHPWLGGNGMRKMS